MSYPIIKRQPGKLFVITLFVFASDLFAIGILIFKATRECPWLELVLIGSLLALRGDSFDKAEKPRSRDTVGVARHRSLLAQWS